MSAGFSIIGASTFKFINKFGFQSFRNTIFKYNMVMFEITPKYGNNIRSTNFRPVVKTGLLTNILLRNFNMHLSTNLLSKHFCKNFFECFNLKMKFTKIRNNRETPM